MSELPPSSPPPAPKQRTSPRTRPRPAVNGITIDVDPVAATHPEVPIWQVILHEVRRDLRGYATSLVFHLVLLVIFGLIVLHHVREFEPLAVIGTFGKPEDAKSRQARFVPVEVEAAPSESSSGNPSPKANTETETAPATSGPQVAVVSPQQVKVGHALGARGQAQSAARDEFVARSGGTGETEKAVAAALGWLSKCQKPDGHWQLQKKDPSLNWSDPGYPDGGELKTDTGATALAVLCFLGAGNTHQSGTYQKNVSQGINWLLKTQQLNGNLHDWKDEGRPSTFYSHGQATIALCEAYALTHDAALVRPIEKALDYIYRGQDPKGGGWKYRPLAKGDLSVTGWQIMALQTARMAGLQVPDEVLDRATNFLDTVQLSNGAQYRYDDEPQSQVTPAMTAEGLLCRQYLGWPRNHPAMLEGVDFLINSERLPDWSGGRRNVYFWYYATQTLHNMQGENWDKWNQSLRVQLVKAQVKTGSRLTQGSWAPFKPAGEPNEHAQEGGRLYMTCLCTLMLEVYYRHLPLYEPQDANHDVVEPP